MRNPTRISPGWSTVRPGLKMNSSALTVRVPFAPAMTHSAPRAINAAGVSAAGEPLHKFPPTEQRFLICTEPIRPAASVNWIFVFDHLIFRDATTRHGGPETKASLRIKSKDLQLRDVFHINDHVRSSDTGAHLDEQSLPPIKARPLSPALAKRPSA